MVEHYVTGASGFIGSNLMKKLKGETVSYEQGRMVYDDFNNLFFLGTYGNMAHHKDVGKMIAANVRDVMWWLESDLVKRLFIFMSSSSVLLPVQTPYSRTKRAAEEILQALPELKSCIVRPYSVTGVGEQKEHLIPTLIRSCMEGEEMPFDPYPVHDFVDVSDIVDALIYCADNQITGIIELGTGMPVRNEAVLELVAHFCQKRPNIYKKDSLRSYDTDEWFCRNKPDWFKPKKTIANSIEEMVKAYRDEHP